MIPLTVPGNQSGPAGRFLQAFPAPAARTPAFHTPDDRDLQAIEDPRHTQRDHCSMRWAGAS